MNDTGALRSEITDKYRELCTKIGHEPNTSFVRGFATAPVKSFYLDIIFRGNDKLNFNHRLSDHDVILLSSAFENHEKVVPS